jgi:NADPH-dependent 2,4-dienoyl-CoA reductase/sulfur reductase-like enzyme
LLSQKNLIVIGGGACGASTAAEAKHNDTSLNITILERGQFVSYASCPTPYFIANEIRAVDRLIALLPEKFRETGIETQLNMEVLNINCQSKKMNFSIRLCPLVFS